MRLRKFDAFTLVEIMIVMAIIALLAALAVSGFLRARKRTYAARVLNDLLHIDSAIDQSALETNKTKDSPVSVTNWTRYLNKDTTLYAAGKNILGEDYGPQTVDTLFKIPPVTFDTLAPRSGRRTRHDRLSDSSARLEGHPL